MDYDYFVVKMFGDRSVDVGVITASLKIPVPASTSFTLNLDDTDIPFIEDPDRQHMTFGKLFAFNVLYCLRYRTR